jgi:DNA modification methylase
MKIENRLIADLKPAEYNPRQISTKQYNDLKESIKKFSLVDPIIINKDNTVIGGHQRLKICKELKHIDIDCVVLDLSKEDERELNIRLNKSGGEWDFDILANQFDIEELKDWGFKEIELGLNIDKISVEGNTEDDHIPEVKESRVKLGDVWELGKHRLICGDNMDLMKQYQDNHFDLAIVDPPYGGNDAIGLKDNKTKGKQLAKRTNYNLFKNTPPKKEYFEELIRISKNQIIWGVNFYKNFDLSGGRICWDKKGTAFGRGELAYYSGSKSVNICEIIWNGMIQQDMKNKEKRIHPTQKPIALYKWLLENYAEKEFKIIDTHLGSGSSLIASIKHNIKEFVGMELDTKYCDVIIERWEQFTGQKANKLTV